MSAYDRTPRCRRSSVPARIAAAVVGLALLAHPAAAQDVPEYRIGPGDVLKIAVYGEETLSGEFRVGSSGTIGYPLLGHIDVAGHTVAEAEDMLTQGMAQQIAAASAPTIVIMQYAPVYVVGDIERSGTYNYEPGMIALELIALAGGMRRAAAGENGVTGLIAAEQRLTDLRTSQFTLAVTRLRLQAEIENRELDLSSAPDGLVPPKVRAQVIANEKQLFETRRKILTGQLDALAAQRSSYDLEIDALESSITLHNEEIDMLDQQVKTQEDLVTRGLAVQSRLLEMKREYSSHRRNFLEAQSYLARAKQRQADLDLRVRELNDMRERENVEALRQLDIDTARLEDEIGAAWSTLSELRRQLNDPALSRPNPPQFTIIRHEDGRRVEVAADQFSEIMPRDILRIETVTPSGRSSAALSVPSAAPAVE